MQLCIFVDCNLFRVPEDKCHMVLPDIGEEPEDGSTRLSLTSLLLGKLSYSCHTSCHSLSLTSLLESSRLYIEEKEKQSITKTNCNLCDIREHSPVS